MNDEFWTVQEVANALHVSSRTVRRLIQSGDLPAVRISKRAIRLPRSGTDRYLAQRAERHA